MSKHKKGSAEEAEEAENENTLPAPFEEDGEEREDVLPAPFEDETERLEIRSAEQRLPAGENCASGTHEQTGKGKKRKNSKGKKALAVILLILVVIGGAVFVYAAGWAGSYKVAQFDGEKLGVFFLDVGQGDAILIRSPEDSYMMIDAGPGKSARSLVRTLKNYGVKTIDYFVLTHPDEDHIGGADEILKEFEVKTVLTGDAGAATKSWADVIAAIEDEGCADIVVSPGSGYTFYEGCTFRILGPIDPESAGSTNDQSVVLRLDCGETSFLFTGDAGKDEEASMLAAFGKDAFDVDVLKLGHHGSASSSSPEFLDAASPSYAVVSCGKDNSYGHPHGSVLKALKERKIQVLRTDEEGTVILQSDGKQVEITQFFMQTPFERFLSWVKSWFT